jgi:hypothetical protein
VPGFPDIPQRNVQTPVSPDVSHRFHITPLDM